MKKTAWISILLLTASIALSASLAWAQDEGDSSGTQDRTQERQRIMERIEADPNLDEGQRERMRKNLRECEQLGLNPEELDALFPTGDSRYGAETRLKVQAQVMELAREGRPVDLVCDKMAEGQMKGASDAAVMRVAEQMGENLRFAHRYLEGAKHEGIEAPGNPENERQLERGVALNRWRGLNDGEFEQLQERARERARDGSCEMTDLCAAAESATELREMGVDSERAMGLCGEALRQGYQAREMRQLAWMVGEAQQNGADGDELCDQLQQRVRQREHMGEIEGVMHQHGWMGSSGDGGGHGWQGGHSPVDDVMGGGHRGENTGGGGGHGGGGHGGGGHGGS